MPAHDKTDEVVKGGAEDEGVGEGSGCCLGVVEGVHEEEDFELAPGVAGGITDSGGEGDEAVYEDGVGLEGEYGVVLALVLGVAEVLVGAGSVGLALHIYHLLLYIELRFTSQAKSKNLHSTTSPSQ